ncbi:MAG: ABC transporter permease [Actinobacteria bacterium]|nr:ABC transporter permease [Actinomycetota bacterium]
MIGPIFDFGWVVDNSDEIISRTLQHVWLTLIAVGIGFLISFPLGVYSHRHRHFYGIVAGVSGLLYTIPSLALFAFLLPLTGLSTLTAEIGLVSYTLLILIRNIVAGLDGVPADVREAARGMGYTERQILWRIDLPLALPVIVAGVRIAVVTTIGLVTITALIGQGGLGYFIRQGLDRFYGPAIITGVVLSVALAVTFDRLIILSERVLSPWTRASATRSGG